MALLVTPPVLGTLEQWRDGLKSLMPELEIRLGPIIGVLSVPDPPCVSAKATATSSSGSISGGSNAQASLVHSDVQSACVDARQFGFDNIVSVSLSDIESRCASVPAGPQVSGSKSRCHGVRSGAPESSVPIGVSNACAHD